MVQDSCANYLRIYIHIYTFYRFKPSSMRFLFSRLNQGSKRKARHCLHIIYEAMCLLSPLGRMAALCYLVSHERGPLGRAIYSQFSREPTIIDESGSFMIYAEVIFSLLRLLFSPSCRLCVWLRQDSEFHGIEYSTRETYHCWFRALPDEYDSSDKALHDAAITLVGHGKQEPI